MNKKIFYIPLCLLVPLFACSLDLRKDTEALPNIKVIKNTIYMNDQPYAELLYYEKHYYEKHENNSYRGIAIKYFTRNEEFWIYPEEGWQVKEYNSGKIYTKLSSFDEILNNYNRQKNILLGYRYPSKGSYIATWCYDVKISDDGKYVYYKVPGVFYESSYKYKIKYYIK